MHPNTVHLPPLLVIYFQYIPRNVFQAFVSRRKGQTDSTLRRRLRFKYIYIKVDPPTSMSGPSDWMILITTTMGIQIMDAKARVQPIPMAQSGYWYILLYVNGLYLTKEKIKQPCRGKTKIQIPLGCVLLKSLFLYIKKIKLIWRCFWLKPYMQVQNMRFLVGAEHALLVTWAKNNLTMHSKGVMTVQLHFIHGFGL